VFDVCPSSCRAGVDLTRMPLSKFLIRKLKFLNGAEGGLYRSTLFLPFLLGIFDFLRKTVILGFRTVRTSGMVRTQLYLSCSSLCSNSEVLKREPPHAIGPTRSFLHSLRLLGLMAFWGLLAYGRCSKTIGRPNEPSFSDPLTGSQANNRLKVVKLHADLST
jgi:hypothetical protein